jgi:ATP-dependent RNA circularization protein (DNA/RNA ligase family)
MEYPKINSLWKREGWYFDQAKKVDRPFQENRQSFIAGDYAAPEFGSIKKWHVEEKVDGTNIRVFLSCRMVGDKCTAIFGGRTGNAQIPCHLLDFLQSHFSKAKTESLMEFPGEMILFGEGYGPRIQAAGGNYRKDPGLILFDVRIGDWWLRREDVKAIADKLELPMVPEIGIMAEEEIVEFVKSKPLSQCSVNPQMMEGVVCRSDPLMLTRSRQPVMFKLKCKEF